MFLVSGTTHEDRKDKGFVMNSESAGFTFSDTLSDFNSNVDASIIIDLLSIYAQIVSQSLEIFTDF